MPVDEALLAQSYAFAQYSVISSTQISHRATAIIDKLRSESTTSNEKPVLVALTAKSKSASKLISIVEIAKRELPLCYQYNAVSSTTTEITATPKPTDATRKDNDASDESDDGFEAVPTTADGPVTKKQTLSIMTIYLSTSSVRELKIEYGEQVHKT